MKVKVTSGIGGRKRRYKITLDWQLEGQPPGHWEGVITTVGEDDDFFDHIPEDTIPEDAEIDDMESMQIRVERLRG